MITIQQLLAAAKIGAAIPSNYRLARVLGVTDNTVGNWQNGRALPSDATVGQLAQMAGIDPDAAVAAIHAARASDDGERSRWTRIADRLARSGAVAGAVILSALVSASPDASAMAKGGALVLDMPHRLYIMSTRVFAYLARLARPGPSFCTV